ncbi:TatD family hydrolase [Tunicatimonas pelagia]|uniref:TatD family hydrolase n=1 Tax=Tunicatimonas pelagia TaxID=931531 RepID=UPI002666E733|nr:TatD family hydrolase [Tunicatimonas pelagia]WKN41352.1 TatD family hydrolase [Tunicatimonas pelagia]
MEWIDTHAHIYDEQFTEDIADVLNRCQEASVNRIYMPNIDHTTVDAMLELEHRYPEQCIPMMGLHPCSVKKDFERELYLVEEWLGKRSFVAVGEIGLDYYWDTTFKEQQQEAFRIQIDLAKKHQLPIVIHTRDSFENAIQIVEELNSDDLTGIFHCFTGSVEEGERITDAGFYLGLGGVSTFKNSGMNDVIPHLNVDKIVLETDSPYLAPTPHRGKRNEPSYIPLIGEKVAEFTKTTPETIAEKTNQNAYRLFSKAES